MIVVFFLVGMTILGLGYALFIECPPIISISVTLLFIFGIWGIVLGYKQKTVFFHNMRDVIFTALATLVCGAGGFYWLYFTMQYQSQRNLDPVRYPSDWVGLAISIALLSIFALYILLQTFRHNKNVFNVICVACGRILMGCSTPLFLIGISSLYGDSRERPQKSITQDLVGFATIIYNTFLCLR